MTAMAGQTKTATGMTFASTAPSLATADVGLDFIHSVARDIKTLQQDLRESVTAVMGGLEREQDARKRCLASQNERLEELGEQVKAEAAEREAMALRVVEFEQKSRTWVCALGAGSKAAKERLTSLEASSEASTLEKVNLERRLAQVETALPKISQEMMDKFLLKEVAERDRAVCLSLQRRVEEGANSAEAAHQSLNSALQSLTSDLQARAWASEVTNLDSKMSGVHAALKLVQDDVTRKALTSDFESVSERIAHLSQQVTLNRSHAQNRAGELEKMLNSHETSTCTKLRDLSREVDLRAHFVDVYSKFDEVKESQASALAKMEKRLDVEGSRVSKSVVALEKDLNTMRIEVSPLPQMVKVADESVTNLLRTQQKHESETQRIKSRLDSLECGYSSKADVTVTAKQAVEISDQTAKCASVEHRTGEVEQQLDALFKNAKEQGNRLVTVETRAADLRSQLSQKAEALEVHPKDCVEKMLMQYYKRDEIDALLCRVWWRLGDTSSAPKSLRG